MRIVASSILILFQAALLAGCLSIGGESELGERIEREVAELVKLYRQCLQKYEAEPMKAKENCAAYRDAIHDLAPDSKKSIVAELLDRLGSKKSP